MVKTKINVVNLNEFQDATYNKNNVENFIENKPETPEIKEAEIKEVEIKEVKPKPKRKPKTKTEEIKEAEVLREANKPEENKSE